MKAPRVTRRRYLVKRGLQLRYALLVVLCMSAATGLTGAVLEERSLRADDLLGDPELA